MSMRFAERMKKVPRSFIREMLKVTERGDIISFAGGLPHPASFPVAEIAEAAQEGTDGDGGGGAAVPDDGGVSAASRVHRGEVQDALGTRGVAG